MSYDEETDQSLNIPPSSYCCCCCYFQRFCYTLALFLTNDPKLSWKGPFLKISTWKVTSDHKTGSEIGHNTDLWSLLINYVTSGHEIVSDVEIAQNGICLYFDFLTQRDLPPEYS